MTACLFDLFNTLVQIPRTLPSEREVLGIDQAQWARVVESPECCRRRALGEVAEPMEIVREIVRAAGKALSPEDEREFLRRRLARWEDAMLHVRPEILATLLALKERGYPLCVVSNADRVDILHWGSSPLSPLFDEVIFSCDVRMMKPDREIYLLAAQRVGCPPEGCVFIGDGGSDELMGARRVGMRTVQVRHFVQREVEGADVIVDRFEELLDLF